MKIIQHRERITETTYARDFRWRDDRNAGFSFPCDAEGNVELDGVALENYNKCLSGEHDVVDYGIDVRENTWTQPAIGLCGCGGKVHLANFTNTCACGADYNSSGQRLAPREQWGEETGEHWTECY